MQHVVESRVAASFNKELHAGQNNGEAGKF